MRGRILLALGWLAVALGFAAWAVRNEADLEPPRPIPDAEMKVRPATVDMIYEKDSRRTNLVLLGLRGQDIDLAEERLIDYDRRREKLRSLLVSAPLNLVSYAFCHEDLPMPYRAALLLVKQDGGRTSIRDLRVTTGLEPWEAFPLADVSNLFETWEVRPKRPVFEDTRMALAALVSGRTQEALEPLQDPWQPVENDGSFKRVATMYPEVERLTREYLAAAVALAEIVDEDPAAFRCVRGDP